MPTPVNKSGADTLASIRHAVEQCRQGSIRANFPDELKRRIVEQTQHVPVSKLAQSIGVGVSSINRWQKSFHDDLPDNESADKLAIPTSDSFIALTPATVTDTPAQRVPITIELGTDQHPRQYRLQAEVELAVFQQLLQRIAQALVV